MENGPQNTLLWQNEHHSVYMAFASVAVRWGQGQQSVFMSLALAIAKTTLLQLPDLNMNIALPTGASDCGPGVDLLQKILRWSWVQEEQTVFMSLTLDITQTAFLQLSDLNKRYVLSINVCDNKSQCFLYSVLWHAYIPAGKNRLTLIF